MSAAFLHETVTDVHHWNDNLFSFKTTRDPGLRFINGQFVMIGLEVNGRPLLLIHGEGDTDIAISNSERLQQAYPAAHLLRIPGAPHVKGFQTDRTLYLTELTAFLASL